jgi:hypothetical protein
MFKTIAVLAIVLVTVIAVVIIFAAIVACGAVLLYVLWNILFQAQLLTFLQCLGIAALITSFSGYGLAVRNRWN